VFKYEESLFLAEGGTAVMSNMKYFGSYSFGVGVIVPYLEDIHV
jgi:hypothetical protein